VSGFSRTSHAVARAFMARVRRAAIAASPVKSSAVAAGSGTDAGGVVASPVTASVARDVAVGGELRPLVQPFDLSAQSVDTALALVERACIAQVERALLFFEPLQFLEQSQVLGTTLSFVRHPHRRDPPLGRVRACC
jgi:hypothetical protein